MYYLVGAAATVGGSRETIIPYADKFVNRKNGIFEKKFISRNITIAIPDCTSSTCTKTAPNLCAI